MTPNLFFRVRKNGIAVFRVAEDRSTHRLELLQIAVAKEKTGEIKPKAGITLSDPETEAIKNWLKNRSTNDASEMSAICDQLNFAAQWVQADASDAEISSEETRLLMSIHDLRTTLVRRLAKIAANSD